MNGFLFTCVVVVILVSAIGYVCAALDLHWPLPVKQIVLAVVLALTLSTALYAAEIVMLGCNDFERYSFLWYISGCFWGEHSS
jgi:ABC-type amino acid transport system permease subunit